MIARKTLSVLAAALLFAGAGCITVSTDGTTASGNDGGVFKTGNKGDAWAQTVAVATTTGEARAIAGVNVATMVQDPSDPAALYIGTGENGMYYSYDAGASWQQPAQMSRGRVPAISVDPKNKCRIFAAKDNVIASTVDCSRNWSVMYIDARPGAAMTGVLIDHFNTNIIWVSNAAGDLLRSADGGVSWVNVKTLPSAIVRLAMHAADSRTLYVATRGDGVWRTRDGGSNWANLAEKYEQYDGAYEFYDIALGVSDPNTVILASTFGLLRSTDAGDTWSPIELLTPAGEVNVYAVALDPRDPNALYYGTATNFYRSPNGGVNWITKKLPSSRTPTALIVDRSDANVLYMGVTRFK